MSSPKVKPKTKSAIDFPCPECGAGVGNVCYTKTSRSLLHRSRVLLAAERRRRVRSGR